MYYLEHFDLLFGQSSLEVLSGFAQPVDEESNHDKEDNHSWRSNNRVVNMVVEQKVVMPCIVLSFVPVTKRSPESDHETGKNWNPDSGTELKCSEFKEFVYFSCGTKLKA